MFKKDIRITKDYFSLVNINIHLILFIIFDLLYIISSLFIPVFESKIIESITNKMYDESIILILGLGAVYLIYNFFIYFDYKSYALFFRRVYVEVHSKLINAVYNFDEEYTKKISMGRLINTSSMDIINISELPSFLVQVVTASVNLIIIYIVFFRQNIFIGLYVILINMSYIYFCNYCNKKRAFYFSKQRKYADKLTGLLSQVLNGLKDVKSFNFTNKLNNKFDGYRKKWQVNYYQVRKYLFTKESIVILIIDIGKVLLYLFLLSMLVRSKISLAIFLLLISYYGRTEDVICELMSFDMSINEEAVSLYRIKEVISYGDDALKLEGNNMNDNIIGTVEFKNVSFNYDDSKTLSNVSFKINPNELTTIVGKTGAGKTTIFNLLLRLYKTQKGKIFINNVDIYDYSKKIYNSNIAVVNQKTFMFNMSIRENLSLIDSNKERQINACKRVGIHDFIMSLPKGYNTILKEDGINLSGGQKQLLSLARALLTSSEIILLDEVTSSLDPNTTNQIIKLLEDLKQDHTIITITHNKDVMMKSDKLIVINNGKISDIGNHKDLIKNSPVYKELFLRITINFFFIIFIYR